MAGQDVVDKVEEVDDKRKEDTINHLSDYVWNSPLPSIYGASVYGAAVSSSFNLHEMFEEYRSGGFDLSKPLDPKDE